MENSIVIPARKVDKPPQHNWAVYSLRTGSQTIELESSFADKTQAETMFERQYSKWGLLDTAFYLIDWQKQQAIREHVPTPVRETGYASLLCSALLAAVIASAFVLLPLIHHAEKALGAL